MKRDFFQKKVLNRIHSIELVISEKCQNACTYCYRNRLHKKSNIITVNPKTIEIFIKNLYELFPELTKIERFELFGGEPFLDYSHIFSIFEILNKFDNIKKVVVPTNGRLLLSLNKIDREKLLNSWNFEVGISMSIDGINGQRNLSNFGRMLGYEEIEENDEFFKNLRDLQKEIGFGVHPMLYFGNNQNWVEQVKKWVEHGFIPYLLEIRHPLSNDEILDSVKNLVFVANYIFKNVDKKHHKRFNTIFPIKVPRGLGCSALTTITIMPNGDIPFCHRVIEPPYVMGNVLTKQIDYSKFVNYKTFDHRNNPECVGCPIRKICSGQCLGAAYEYYRGYPWLNIPSICQYNLLKYYVFSEFFEIWNNFLIENRVNKKDILKALKRNNTIKEKMGKMMKEIKCGI